MTFNTFYNWNYQQIYVDEAKRPRAVTINERDPEIALKKITAWLTLHYPGLHVNHVELTKPDQRVYARANFRTALNQQKVVLFDVTAAANGFMNTNIRMFSPGTVVRIWPGTRTTPTRHEILI
ncbi:unnamed protein product [Adineta steineri]|uniref:Uncharacterized protein n=1 Tax=Adineta steineri TaxID=433720 RepID=A0A813SMS1_9BILA|nr:unnamed protein product [Adineta steineri]CAF0801344.1 unnamed protein product [Adineta steineri]CAF3743727.1 unnamed protein product [Adineta steineri]CAF4228099.1 unnamed protein product [Adineta steineri]